MTINERLYDSGYMDEFDKAREVRDRAKMVEILVKTELIAKNLLLYIHEKREVKMKHQICFTGWY